MKKIFLFLALFCFLLPLGAQEVHEEELKSYGNASISFTSYNGPHSGPLDSVEEIINIGRRMGDQISLEESGQSRYGIKYSVIHIYNPGSELFNADIFILHESSRVDHIINLRFILAGYLQETYGYSFNDAQVLAEFVTYYNAVYYKNIGYFQSKYNADVMANLSGSNAGIATHYSEWPGNTRMVIPLRGIPTEGSLSNLDTSELTENDVIEEMRQEEDKNIDSRKDMTELRERELEEEQNQIDEQNEELEQREEQVQEELTELQEREERGETLTEEEETRQQELVEEQEEIDQQQEELAGQQEELDQRTEEVIEQRDEIAEDENQTFENESENQEMAAIERPADVNPVFYHLIDTEGEIPFGKISKYDLNAGKYLLVSPINSIRGRTVLFTNSGVIAIAGMSQGDGVVKLVVLDEESLEMAAESEEMIYAGSFLIQDGASIYALVQRDALYLGKFNQSLELQDISEEPIARSATLRIINGSLLILGEDGKVLVLSTNDLTKQKEME